MPPTPCGALQATDLQVVQATVHRLQQRGRDVRLAAAEPLFLIAAQRPRVHELGIPTGPQRPGGCRAGGLLISLGAGGSPCWWR